MYTSGDGGDDVHDNIKQLLVYNNIIGLDFK
jgi:hypothetical protein